MASDNITTFKTTINKDRDLAKLRDHSHISGANSFSVEPNTSVTIKIDFKSEYTALPFFNYMFICGDNEFGLEHYIKELTPKYVVIGVSNIVDCKRTITISYKIDGTLKSAL